MSETEKLKRRFWQFHLATAVLGTLLSGLLFALNFCLYPGSYKLSAAIYGKEATAEYTKAWVEDDIGWIGWPIVMGAKNYDLPDDYSGPVPQEILSSPKRKIRWFPRAVIINVAVGIVIIITTGVVFEWLIRRREARKP